jgi:hypothetical protein
MAFRQVPRTALVCARGVTDENIYQSTPLTSWAAPKMAMKAKIDIVWPCTWAAAPYISCNTQYDALSPKAEPTQNPRRRRPHLLQRYSAGGCALGSKLTVCSMPMTWAQVQQVVQWYKCCHFACPCARSACQWHFEPLIL